MAPVLVVDPHDFFYGQVTPADVPEIVEASVLGGRPVERLLYTDPATGGRVTRAAEVPFYKDQLKIVLRNCGFIDPRDINQYIERDGYAAAAKVLSSLTPEQVVEQVTLSGLRGRGGAGFPTGRKWGLARASQGQPKYLVCNADEGDPGAFMDRAVLEGDPHSVIEGMIIGAYAIGATEGFVYVRAEYPIAVEHLKIAIAQATEAGLLGKNILGSGFSFAIKIKKGSGAFVCGEETALIASIEGRRGMPRPRPPFPAQSGIWGRPTCINNVETLANIPPILLPGRGLVRRHRHREEQGHQGLRPGRQGEQHRPGGGADGHRPAQGGLRHRRRHPGRPAVQGRADRRPLRRLHPGPVPRPAAWTTRSLAAVGSIMGSGGMIVVDERTCMVDFARFFLEFTQDESCGKCVPCRIGTKRMLEILEDICAGRGRGARTWTPCRSWPPPSRTRPSAGWGRPPPTPCSPR